MSKSIFLGDLHQGVSDDDLYLQSKQYELFVFMCEYAKKHNIKRLIQTGDWFDERRGLSQETMHFQRTKVIPLFEETFDEVITIVGNHDMHLKNKIRPNSVSEMFTERSKFRVIEEPTTVLLGSVSLDLIPWICTENEKQVKDFIKKSQSEMCVGHFELDGFEFYAGVKSSGEPMEFLCEYKKVISGHYHTRSQHGNVEYIGTPYTLTMGDANDERGFVVFDDVEFSTEFIKNPVCNHYKLFYNNDFDVSNLSLYNDKRVTLIVEESNEKLEGVLTTLEKICNEFTKKDFTTLQIGEIAESELKQQNTLKVIESLVDCATIESELKSKVRNRCQRLYAMASEKE